MKITLLKYPATALLLLFLFVNCRKLDVQSGTPRAIKKEIRKFEKTSACSDSHVDKYEFQSKTVYVFDPGTCGADMQSAVYDAKGKRLGDLGGFTGNMKINNENFDTARFISTVWKK